MPIVETNFPLRLELGMKKMYMWMKMEYLWKFLVIYALKNWLLGTNFEDMLLMYTKNTIILFKERQHFAVMSVEKHLR